MNKLRQKGVSVIEMMLAIAMGLFLTTVILYVYSLQAQNYKTSTSQGFMQNAENALVGIMIPYLHSVGYAGCSTIAASMSNLSTSSPAPLGSLNTNGAPMQGYAATTNLTSLNASNDTTASHWSPTLDSTLVGKVETGSDVLILLGAIPGSQPTALTSNINSGSTSSFSVANTAGFIIPGLAAVSDCAKGVIFYMSSMSSSTITIGSGSGILTNLNSNLSVNFLVGSQVIPIQQTAFFVAQGSGGQSSLMMATLQASGWNIQQLIPGVDTMKVQYGIGVNGAVTQYVSASSVTNWAQVYSIQLGFLFEGTSGSGGKASTTYSVLGQTITVPADNRLRHVFLITVNLRNTLS